MNVSIASSRSREPVARNCTAVGAAACVASSSTPASRPAARSAVPSKSHSFGVASRSGIDSSSSATAGSRTSAMMRSASAAAALAEHGVGEGADAGDRAAVVGAAERVAQAGVGGHLAAEHRGDDAAHERHRDERDAGAGKGADLQQPAGAAGEPAGDAVGEIAETEAGGEEVVGAHDVVDEAVQEGLAVGGAQRALEVAGRVEPVGLPLAARLLLREPQLVAGAAVELEPGAQLGERVRQRGLRRGVGGRALRDDDGGHPVVDGHGVDRHRRWRRRERLDLPGAASTREHAAHQVGALLSQRRLVTCGRLVALVALRPVRSQRAVHGRSLVSRPPDGCETGRMTRLRDSTVLITGAARGLGRLLAIGAATRGARAVVLWDLDVAALEPVAAAVERLGARALARRVDITDADAVVAAVAEAERLVSGVDVLVHNAGVVTGATLLESTEAQVRRTFEVNALALYPLTRAVLPGMLARDRGLVVTIASAAGLVGVARQTDYSASKHAAVGFTESLRAELRAEGSRVSTLVVCPYYVSTGMFDGVTTRVPLLLPIQAPKRVAVQIVKAIERGRGRLLTPWFVHAVHWARLVPQSAADRLLDLFGINEGMRGFRGRR